MHCCWWPNSADEFRLITRTERKQREGSGGGCEVPESGYCLLGILQLPFKERLTLPEVNATASPRRAGETGSPFTGRRVSWEMTHFL